MEAAGKHSVAQRLVVGAEENHSGQTGAIKSWSRGEKIPVTGREVRLLGLWGEPP